MLPRLDGVHADAHRERDGVAWRSCGRFRACRFIARAADASPAYLRLPVLLADSETRDRALAALTPAGIGAIAILSRVSRRRAAASASASARLPATTGGRDVAHRILTLPTHPFVRRRRYYSNRRGASTSSSNAGSIGRRARRPDRHARLRKDSARYVWNSRPRLQRSLAPLRAWRRSRA